jgi:hypothetical protein
MIMLVSHRYQGDGQRCTIAISINSPLASRLEDELDLPPVQDFVFIPYMDSPFFDLAIISQASPV